MTEYRKTFRTWYKFPDDGKRMLVVENKRYGSSIRFVDEYPYRNDVLLDPEYLPCTEQEFNEAKSIAVKRIQEEKID
jgi:hypothetical protein